MAFNQYAWDLYKNSYDGKTKIEFLSEADGYTLFSKYYPRADSVLPNVYNDWLENIYCYGLSDYEQPNSLEDAKNIVVEGEESSPADAPHIQISGLRQKNRRRLRKGGNHRDLRFGR